jgi:DnaK suppressor protein
VIMRQSEQRSETTTASGRLERLREILSYERNQALAQIQVFRRDQEEEALDSPGDELDMARSLSDAETHASLIERADSRLKAIDAAFIRIERGIYGVCEECGEAIPVVRLKVLPFTRYCVDCQSIRSKELGQRMGKSSGKEDMSGLAEERPSSHVREQEAGDSGQEAPSVRRRRVMGRKNQSAR